MTLSLEQLLLARAQIARLGEKGQMRWWETDAHGSAGGKLLTRLFPRTAQWAAVELAIEAAAAAHRRDLPPLPAVTLFDLGEQVNRSVNDLLLQNKTAAMPTEPFQLDLAREDLSGALVEAGLTTAKHLTTAKKVASNALADKAVCVGDLPDGADRTSPDVFGLLVAGYQFSSPTKFLIPYLRVI